ncbi:MAG TPA: ribosome silencing factor [Rhodospirillaceae bacterium]|jgi:ribosome-associated protein|nr:ribosome silencing factor [Alphaproteobacteria bacterium]HBH26109.1 ribosome silencing factor [Rhodospirillaceae bacterium]
MRATALRVLVDGKAQDVVTIDLTGRMPLADTMLVASGTSARHVSALAEKLAEALKPCAVGPVRTHGLAQGDWALVDAGDVIVHVMRPEVRAFYAIEDLWGTETCPR